VLYCKEGAVLREPEAINPYVNGFIAFVKSNLELAFLVTRIGGGIAGFKDEDIAPLYLIFGNPIEELFQSSHKPP